MKKFNSHDIYRCMKDEKFDSFHALQECFDQVWKRLSDDDDAVAPSLSAFYMVTYKYPIFKKFKIFKKYSLSKAIVGNPNFETKEDAKSLIQESPIASENKTVAVGSLQNNNIIVDDIVYTLQSIYSAILSLPSDNYARSSISNEIKARLDVLGFDTVEFDGSNFDMFEIKKDASCDTPVMTIPTIIDKEGNIARKGVVFINK